MKPIQHLTISTWMDTLCWIDTELLDNYWIPHIPACDSKERELENRPIQDWFSYKELATKHNNYVICKKCCKILNDLMLQYIMITQE